MSHEAAPGLLHEFFTRSASTWPHRVAVDVPPGRLRPSRHRTTYAELDRQSNALARRLAPFVTGECIVAIMLPRTSAHLYAAQIGVMKAGAAYTCFDLAFPDERLRETIDDARPMALLTDAAGRARGLAAGFPANRIIDVIDTLHAHDAADPAFRPAWLAPSSLAYVIYTSGTTGRPKGVMIEHRGISNLVQSDHETFRLTTDDRVVQGSSAAYDSSIEEAWLAFAAGAAVVVMDEEAARLGPDIVGWLRDERVTVFCPPPTLLRATGCEDPARELPELKLLYVGGEALPQDVADRWATGCALVNGYGPTECSVTVTRERIAAGKPVTIGTPVPNVHAWIVDEDLQPVGDGAQGELVLGGIALARGYWNQPDLTAQRFPHHPTLGRIYRTGDIAQRDCDGALLYFGRGDAQVKLRGYRVELGAIESALIACDGVRAAACAVQNGDGRQTLVAFIVPEAMVPVPTIVALQDALRATLPEYMIPARMATIESLPTSLSGKLDRAALPLLNGTAPSSAGVDTAPANAVEHAIADAVRQVLSHATLPGTSEDFFTALGGDSLSAAELITRLRENALTSALDVRDVYEARTVAALAQRARPRNASAPRAAPESRTGIPVARTTVLQVLSLLRSLVVASLALWIGAFYVLPAIVNRVGLVPSVFLALPAIMLLAIAWAPLAVMLAVLGKRTLVGRYTSMRAPVWGPFYLRHWLVQQSIKSIPWWVLEGTQFQVMVLRALGARIGRRVHIHRGVNLTRGGWDLLDIGDDVTLSQDSALRIAELDDGHVVFGPVSLGDGVTLGIHVGVGSDCVLEAGVSLADSSSLPRGTRIPAGECWDGIPARPAGQAAPTPVIDTSRDLSPLAYDALLLGARLLLSLAFAAPLGVFALLAVRTWGVETAEATAWLLDGAFSWRILAGIALLEMFAVPSRLVLDALACRAMGRVPNGVSSRWSAGYLRIWLKPMLVDGASRWLYGTLFWPYWLRLSGMTVGRDCEISSLIDTVPETVTIGDKNFFADGIYVGSPQLHRGTVRVAHTTFGSSTFLGNGAIIAGGMQLPDDVLLGICTVAHQQHLRSGSAWFGHPAFELPHREVIEYDAAFTFDPTPLRYATRVFWELSRFVVPALPVFVTLLWFKLIAGWSDVSLPVFILGVLPLATLGASALFAALIVVFKWTLLGKVQPAMHPLWSSWASRWDLVCLAWNVCAGSLVSRLDGTLLLNALLRFTGVHIGKRVVLGTGFAEDLPDPDMLTFEDGATVDCLFQAHTFEDRVLKMDRVVIRAGATVGSNAVLLYGADIGEGTRVAQHSVVLKHEHLRPGVLYAGFPTRPQDDASRW
ncbi:MAG: amino acid adenylation domain-containing protein [Gemmatimonadota bacterium]